MNGVLGHDYALQGYSGPGITWAHETNFNMSHAPIAGAESLFRPVDQQSIALPRSYGTTPPKKINLKKKTG